MSVCLLNSVMTKVVAQTLIVLEAVARRMVLQEAAVKLVREFASAPQQVKTNFDPVSSDTGFF
ncbi:hypothetical protein [Sphingobacterium tabacisoli]|uniref:Uncharacterized protein n=1 Tax=Sphingobacterium tabacisoli TaxID=2044855 RepID=A0ABW5L1F4_9SPHI|nr:hypothetical protein [Sphingobacterium tabacisoli]